MKMLLIAAAIVVAGLGTCLAAVLALGNRLSANHTASRSISINRRVSEVYGTVRDLPNHTSWRPGLKSIEILPAEGGPIRFRENGSNGTVTYEITEDVPDRRMVTTIIDRDLGYSGSWTYNFEPQGEGTFLSITENGEVSNLVFRFMSNYIFGHTAGIDAYLKALSQHLGESPELQE